MHVCYVHVVDLYAQSFFQKKKKILTRTKQQSSTAKYARSGLPTKKTQSPTRNKQQIETIIKQETTINLEKQHNKGTQITSSSK